MNKWQYVLFLIEHAVMLCIYMLVGPHTQYLSLPITTIVLLILRPHTQHLSTPVILTSAFYHRHYCRCHCQFGSLAVPLECWPSKGLPMLALHKTNFQSLFSWLRGRWKSRMESLDALKDQRMGIGEGQEGKSKYIEDQRMGKGVTESLNTVKTIGWKKAQ